MITRIYTLLLFVLLALAACKPDPVEPPIIDNEFTVISAPDPDKVYQLGDTLDFQIGIKIGNYDFIEYLLVNSSGIEKYNYITQSYSDKVDNSGNNGSGFKYLSFSEVSDREIQDTVISYRYIINQADSLEHFSFSVNAKSKQGSGTGYNNTYSIYGFGAYVNSLYVVDTFRIYNNYVGREIGPETITGYDLYHDRYLYGSCVLNDACSDEQTPFAYMVNQTSRDNPENLSFVRGWKAHKNLNGEDDWYKYMVDVSEKSDDLFHNDLRINLEIGGGDNPDRISQISGVEIGDKFAVVVLATENRPSYYGLLRVIDVVDDGTAANQEDYIELVYYR
ncbi:hypothetical protein QWY31_00090 [Cytophagales bacterium LB-30]|uniref:Uncharacterized protein n=1 Tax=Shiella aurantiaca TaxID=3058365 RepID=A0ABT8F0B4_9BACT|nr:hypothetical protein [Shiella aurantiaca]MDN4163873.1 hypothetical protein [Shiella aurantiaca]